MRITSILSGLLGQGSEDRSPTSTAARLPPENGVVHGASDVYEVTSSVRSAKATMTPLGRNLAFFDTDGDGVVGVSDGAQGFQRLGMESAPAWALASAVTGVLGPATGASLWSPFSVTLSKLPLDGIFKDVGIYDERNHFVESRYDELFERADKEANGVLTGDEMRDFLSGFSDPLLSALLAVLDLDLIVSLVGEKQSLGGRETYVLSKERLGSFLSDGHTFARAAARA